jgi:predicted outer membrane lipoprotein
MSIFANKSTRAIAVAALCLGGQAVHAQVAPVQYWIPGGPFGFGGGSTEASSAETYGNVPSFDLGDVRDGGWRNNFPSGMFVRGEAGGIGLNGLSQANAFGVLGALSYEGVQTGYNFKAAGGIPVTFYAGFDTLKYNPGVIAPLAPFNSPSGVTAGYSARAGIEFQPAPNVSLSFGAGYTQQQSGRIDSDINSSLLPGETPMFFGGRR